jgi:putative transposase
MEGVLKFIYPSNKQEERTGSLFQQKTKSKELKNQNQALVCFNYIHFNPVKAKLVLNMEDWSFSSYPDYCGIRDGSLVKKSLAYQFLDIPKEPSNFKDFSNKLLPSI